MANESDHYERVRSVLDRSPGPAGAGPERQAQIQQAKAEGCGGLIEPMQTRPGPGDETSARPRPRYGNDDRPVTMDDWRLLLDRVEDVAGQVANLHELVIEKTDELTVELKVLTELVTESTSE